MFVLIGIYKPHYPEEDYSENRLALFSTQKAAEEYEKLSRLKSYNNWCGQGQHWKQYRSKSLLSGCCTAEIEEDSQEALLVDPLPNF